MAKKDTTHPWQQIEEQAFHAFSEWPLWLVLRQRELSMQTAQTTPTGSVSAQATGTDVKQSAGN